MINYVKCNYNVFLFHFLICLLTSTFKEEVLIIIGFLTCELLFILVRGN